MMMVIATIMTIVFVSYLQSKKIQDVSKRVSLATEVLYHSEKVLANTMLNETGSKEFALTGSVVFLNPLNRSKTVVYKELAELKRLAVDNTTLQHRIDSISAYTTRQIEFSARLVTVRREKGFEAASALSNTGEGMRYVDTIRKLVNEVQADENIFLRQREQKTKEAVTRMNEILIVLAVLVLTLVVITFLAGKKFFGIQKQLADQKLKLNKNKLDEVEEQVGLGTWEFEVGTQRATWSKQMFLLFGLEVSDHAPSVEDFLQRIHPEDEPLIREVLNSLTAGVCPVPQTFRTNPQQHPLRYLAPTGHLEKDSSGNPLKFSGTLRDITVMVEAEQKIRKANRLYLFISQLNQMIVRMTEEKTFFKEACRIAVDIGKFRMAWIGIIDEETKKVIPVMHAGEEMDYLSRIKIISVADVPEGRGPTGTALREGKYIICNDIETDPSMAPWKEAALGRGYYSSIALPIKKFGKVIGTFSFYASEKNFFDTEEITLLQEATRDVAFGLEILENERMRKEAEREVVKVYKEKETTLNRIKDAMVSVDTDWRYTFLNDAALATHPSGREATLGKIIWEVHPEMKGTIFWDKYHEAMETGKVVEVESLYAPMKTWFSVKVYPSHDGLTIFYSDISERKNAEEQLTEKENQLRLFVEYSPAALAMLDMDMKYIVTSKKWMLDYQLGDKDIIGKSHYEVFPEIPQEWKEIHQRCLAGAIEKRDEDMFVRADGSVDWVCWEIHPWRKASGNIGGIIMLTEVITGRIKARDEIVKEKNLSDSIINSLPGIFYLYNKEGKFLRWNKNFEKVSKYQGAEIMQMHPLDFFDTDDKKLIAQKIENTFNLGEDDVQADFLLKTKEKIPYYFTGKAIEYEGSTCLMGVGIDFTERLKAQEQIKETTRKLRQLTAYLQSIREEERKRIGREIHDELGQQLTAIKMDISWIDKKIPADAGLVKSKLKNIIGLLDGSNKSLRRILSELRPGMLDERGLIEAIEWLGRQFTENTGVLVEFKSTETEIKLPEPLAICIFRVYQEALTNIMRYAGASKVRTSFSIKDDMIEVTIEDDGNGFDPAVVQSKQTFGILGMKERVASLNGMLKLESTPGKGTQIVIHIPYQPDHFKKTSA